MTKKEKISPKGGKTIETDLLLGRAIPSPLTMPLRCIQKNISPRCEGSLISILMPISVKDPARLNQQKGGSFGRRGRLKSSFTNGTFIFLELLSSQICYCQRPLHLIWTTMSVKSYYLTSINNKVESPLTLRKNEIFSDFVF